MPARSNILEKTPVVILAGGLGTRLRPALPDLPKGLAPIGSRPFLEIQVRLLKGQGAGRFILCIGHRGRQIREVLGEGEALGVSIGYSIEEEGRLLGTAGALRKAAGLFSPPALVLNGDTFFDIDYGELLGFHREESERRGAIATLALSKGGEEGRYGNVLLDASGSALASFREKEGSLPSVPRWVSAGAYAIGRELLEMIPPDRPCSLEREVFPSALREGRRLAALTSPNRFFDIGTPGDWKRFAEHYGDRIEKAVNEDG